MYWQCMQRSEKVCTDQFCSILFLKTGNVSENDLKLFFSEQKTGRLFLIPRYIIKLRLMFYKHFRCLAVSNINHRCLLSIFLSYGLIKQCANLRSPHFDVSKSEILIRIVFMKSAAPWRRCKKYPSQYKIFCSEPNFTVCSTLFRRVGCCLCH